MTILKDTMMNSSSSLEKPFLSKEELDVLATVLEQVIVKYAESEKTTKPLEKGSFLMDGQPMNPCSEYDSADSVLSFKLKKGLSGGSLVSGTANSEEETCRVIDRALGQVYFISNGEATGSAISYYADSSLFLVFKTAYGRFLAMFYASYNDVPSLYPLQTVLYLAIAKTLAMMREWDADAQMSCSELFDAEMYRSDNPYEYRWIEMLVEQCLTRGRKRAFVAWRKWRRNVWTQDCYFE